MLNNIVTKIVIAAVIAGGVGFYGGMRYAQSQTTTDTRATFNGTQRQFPGGTNQAGAGGRFAGTNSNSFITGEILSKDDQGITVKLRDGGSRIVLMPKTTQVTHAAAGTVNDLKQGDQVTITGKANTDGSFSAESVNVRPNLPATTPSSANQ